MIRQLFSFKGGIHPETNKALSANVPIQPAPLPARVYVPLQNQYHPPARCAVQVGDTVLKGQQIGMPLGQLGTGVHAPTSGTVVAIGDYPQAGPTGASGPCVVIESDGADRWTEIKPFSPQEAGIRATINYLRDKGIVGLGGAAFPSHGKLAQPVQTLILNGAECEPWLTCDDRLMRERADGIVAGGRILCELLQAKEFCIGIEDDKPEAFAALQAALDKLRESGALDGVKLNVVQVPVRYPSGGVKQLIYLLTGLAIPADRLPHQYGVQCFNVGTAYAIHRAIEFGEPLISRIVTLTGDVAAPGNYEVLIGTPIDTLLPLAQPRPGVTHTILGGPMMGVRLSDTRVPIAKNSNCLIAASPRLFPPAPPEEACIRCGACARVCPVNLQPQTLYWLARGQQHEQAEKHHLFDCIECGCCAYVCPAHIPLVRYYRTAKQAVRQQQSTQAAALTARDRFEFRNQRLEREKQEKAARLAARTAEKRAEALAQANASASSTANSDAASTAASAADDKQAMIAAALARARAQQAPDGNGSASAPATTEATVTEPAADGSAPLDKQALIAAALERARQQKATRTADEAVSAAASDDSEAHS